MLKDKLIGWAEIAAPVLIIAGFSLVVLAIPIGLITFGLGLDGAFDVSARGILVGAGLWVGGFFLEEILEAN